MDMYASFVSEEKSTFVFAEALCATKKAGAKTIHRTGPKKLKRSQT